MEWINQWMEWNWFMKCNPAWRKTKRIIVAAIWWAVNSVWMIAVRLIILNNNDEVAARLIDVWFNSDFITIQSEFEINHSILGQTLQK